MCFNTRERGLVDLSKIEFYLFNSQKLIFFGVVNILEEIRGDPREEMNEGFLGLGR